MSDITVIIPTSPIPSNPSTRIIEKAIDSVRTQLPNAPIVISCDGGSGEDYAIYKAGLEMLRRTHQVGPILAWPEQVNQSGMFQVTLAAVATNLILYWEHDWELIGGVPWGELSALILSGKFNYIKLHAAPRISPFHEHLMLERVIYQNGVAYDRYNDAVGGLAVPIIKTKQWSQNPHLASTEFYRKIEREYLQGKCDYIENLLHGAVAHSPWEDWKLGIYNPPEGDMHRVHHLDGRGSR